MFYEAPPLSSSTTAAPAPVSLDGLLANLQQLESREVRLRGLLLGERDQRRSQEGELRTTLQSVQGSLTALQSELADIRKYPSQLGRSVSQQIDYYRIVQHIREVANLVLPFGATVLIVSKGDDDLLELNGRKAMHFLQTPEGVYAGYHPADSAEAIEQLERLRENGAGYLIIPSTAFWWLGHYGEFARHLEARYQRIRADRYCMIYELVRRSFVRSLVQNVSSRRWWRNS